MTGNQTTDWCDVCTVYRIGPKTDPCCTAVDIGIGEDVDSPIIIIIFNIRN